MKEAFGDIWELAKDNNADAVVVTTNGTIKKNGEAVMGRGIAREAAIKHPDLPKRLGIVLKRFGNLVWFHGYSESIFTFPVKHEWYERADIGLIAKSAYELEGLVDDMGYKTILVPRPGCGNGGLKWKDVKPVIEPYLDDRFWICHK